MGKTETASAKAGGPAGSNGSPGSKGDPPKKSPRKSANKIIVSTNRSKGRNFFAFYAIQCCDSIWVIYCRRYGRTPVEEGFMHPLVRDVQDQGEFSVNNNLKAVACQRESLQEDTAKKNGGYNARCIVTIFDENQDNEENRMHTILENCANVSENTYSIFYVYEQSDRSNEHVHAYIFLMSDMSNCIGFVLFRQAFAERKEWNRYQNNYMVPEEWNLTPETGPVVLDNVIPTRDILPIIKALYGNADGEFPANWGGDNSDILDNYFTPGHMNLDAAAELNVGP